MTFSTLSRGTGALALVALLPVATAVADAEKRVEIDVATTAELYAAVQPANAGAIVHLAAGTYALEPSRPNGGRLVLPAGMDLIGVKRRHGLESKIVVPPLGGGQGAIRIGVRNVVRWITVEAVVFSPRAPLGAPVAVGACIDVNVLPPAPQGMEAEVTDCVLVGATRGIRVQHVRGPADGRATTVVLERNEVRDQGDSFEFGIQLQNSGVGSTIDASLRKNVCSGARIGLFVVSLGTEHSTNRVRSQGNVYTRNESGVALYGGRDAAAVGGLLGASHCRAELTSIGDVISDNVGDELYLLGSGGGIVVVGGLHLSPLATPSADNFVNVALRGTTFAGNVADGSLADVSAFGGLGGFTPELLPNGGNRVELRLDEVTTAAPGTFTFACSHPSQPVSEPPNALSVVIDESPVAVDCD
jgi:hypothetical protein